MLWNMDEVSVHVNRCWIGIGMSHKVADSLTRWGTTSSNYDQTWSLPPNGVLLALGRDALSST